MPRAAGNLVGVCGSTVSMAVAELRRAIGGLDGVLPYGAAGGALAKGDCCCAPNLLALCPNAGVEGCRNTKLFELRLGVLTKRGGLAFNE